MKVYGGGKFFPADDRSAWKMENGKWKMEVNEGK